MNRLFFAFRTPNSGYVMYVVLIVLAITGTLAYGMITNRGQTQELAAREMKKLQVALLAESGLTKAEYFLNRGDGQGLAWQTTGMGDTFGNSGSMYLEVKRFGGFVRVSSTGKRDGNSCTINSIVGRDLLKNLKPVLTITGGLSNLLIDDDTRITGAVVLSGGYCEKSNTRQPIAAMAKFASVRKSPTLPFDAMPIKTFIDTISAQRIALLSDPLAVHGDIVINSSNDTLLKREKLVVVGNCTIHGTIVNGKTIICAGFLSLSDSTSCLESTILAESLEVKNATSDRCLFYSEKNLKISGGMQNSQFICEDTIFVGKETKSGALSTWISIRTLKRDTLKTGGVVFEENGQYRGCCLSFTDSTERGKIIQDGPVITLGKRSSYNGCMITDGNIDIDTCKITGHVWAGVIVTNKDQYKNYLFSVQIAEPKAEPPFMLVGEMPVTLNMYSMTRKFLKTNE
jgi:hypothetical protein